VIDSAIGGPHSSNAAQEEQVVVVSIALCNLDALLAQTSPENRETFRQRILQGVTDRAEKLGGQVESCRQDKVFLAFHPRTTLSSAAENGLQFGRQLVDDPLTLANRTVKVQVGIALDNTQQRNGLTAVSERMVAQQGQLVTSQAVYGLTREQWQYDTIGPLRVGDQLVTFYQAIMPKYVREVGTPTTPQKQEQSVSDTKTTHLQQPQPPSVSLDAAQSIATKLMDTGPLGLPGGIKIPELPPPLEDDKAVDPKTLKDETISVFSGYKPPLFGGWDTPLNGNIRYETLVTNLVNELQTWIADPDATGKIVTLSASEGVGKSFVTNNLLLQALIQDPRQPQLVWLSGHNFKCIYQQQVPLFLWIEMFHNLLPIILEGAPAKDIEGWLTQTLSQMDLGDQHDATFDFFKDFLSVTPPTEAALNLFQRHSPMAGCLLALIQSMTKQLPVMIVIDDVHFADVASLDVLTQLLQTDLMTLPVCIVLTYQNGYTFQGELASVLSLNPVSDYRLADLDSQDIELFFQGGPLLGVWQGLTQAQKQDLTTKSQGKTLYLFEAMSYMQTLGLIEPDPQTQGQLRLNKGALNEPLVFPDTVDAILEYRLGQLSDKALYVLQVASVLGERFTLQLLIDLCQYPLEEIKTVMEQLVMQQLVITDFNQTAQFRHPRIWTLIYENTEPELQQQLHQSVLNYLVGLKEKDFTVNPALLAYHAQAGRVADAAYQYWFQAGQYCALVGSHVGANMALGQALAFSVQSLQSATAQPYGAQAEAHGNLLTRLALLNIQQEPELALHLLDQAVQATDPNDPASAGKMVEMLSYKASACEHVGRYTEALGAIQLAQRYVNGVQYPLELTTLKMTELDIFYKLGQLSHARLLFDEVIEPRAAHFQTFAQQPDKTFYFDAYLNACGIDAACRLGQCDSTLLSRLTPILDLAENRQTSELVVPLTLLRIQTLLVVKPHYARVKELLHHLLPTIEAAQLPQLLGQWGLAAMQYHIAIGELKNANDLLLHSLEQAQEAKDYYTWIQLNIQAARIALYEGRSDDAAYILESMATESAEKRFAALALQCWRYLAKAFIQQQNHAQALDIATNALQVAQKPENDQRLETYELTIVQAMANMGVGHIQPAGAALQTQWPLVKATGYQPLIAKNAAAIGDLYAAMTARTVDGTSRDSHHQKALQFYQLATTQWQQIQNSYQAQRVTLRMQQTLSV